MKKIKLSLVGAGGRGRTLAKTAIKTKEYEVIAISDPYLPNAEKTVKELEELQGFKPALYTDFNDMYDNAKPEAVIVACSWETHVEATVSAMEKGIPVAMEVGGAYNEQECWDLVDAYERTKTPFMFLENACFAKNELFATSMIRKGKLGTVVAINGAYGHDLRHILANSVKNHHYRLQEYIDRNCENYPTHELGPIAKILGITRGNKFTKLIACSSKAVGLREYIDNDIENYPEVKDVKIKQGDIFSTMIKTENGELIEIKLDTTTPRVHQRDMVFIGTKGRFQGNEYTILEDGKFDGWEEAYKKYLGNAKEYEEEFLPDMWKNITEEIIETGHGGIDWFELVAWADALKNGKEMPIDVYEAVAVMCITYLSEISIKEERFVEIPDFTRGKYKERKIKDVIDLD